MQCKIQFQIKMNVNHLDRITKDQIDKLQLIEIYRNFFYC